MTETVELSVMVLVKASLVLTSKLEENMCVAAMTLTDDPKWVRLYPVPFRDLEDDSKFRKYQEITVKAIKPKQDRRPETWRPIEGSIQLGSAIVPDHQWAVRRDRISRLGEHYTCDLIERNKSGSGPNTPSLAVVRARDTPELIITERDQEQIQQWDKRAKAIASQPSLFDDPRKIKRVYRMCPWRFRYKYQCLKAQCPGHSQTIIDSEVVALWKKVKYLDGWQDKIRQKFIDDLWAMGKETVMFVGNMEQYPCSFLVLGVFWPPKTPYMQQTLLG